MKYGDRAESRDSALKAWWVKLRAAFIQINLIFIYVLSYFFKISHLLTIILVPNHVLTYLLDLTLPKTFLN